jgi:hypothetical protein
MNKITKQTSTNHENGNDANLFLGLVPINGQRDFFEKEDGVRNWYKCPSCGDENVRWKNIFCENCNCEFEWSGLYELQPCEGPGF